MGVHLAKPITTKESSDEHYEHLSFGVSGMQGWRMRMEDAHCALADIDGKKTSLFGVFDGHGGAEVAMYCAQNIQKFLMDNESFQKGDIPEALTQTFMVMDEAITTKEVIEELKLLANGGMQGEVPKNVEEEAAMLAEEAEMPIEELLQRIKGSAQQVLDEKKATNGDVNHDDEDDDDAEADEKLKEKLKDMINGHNGEEEGMIAVAGGTKSRGRKMKAPVRKSEDGEGSSSSAAEGSSSSSAETEEGGSSGGSKTDDAAASEESKESEDKKEDGVENEDDDDEDDDLNSDEDDSDIDEEDDEDFDDDEDDEDLIAEEFQESDGVCFADGSEEVGSDSGTTAVVACIFDNKLYVANAGDSRCVVCRAGKTLEMSFDHKPESEIEKTRIEKAGSKIHSDGRVNGGLNLSRAIGDHAYKKNADLPLAEQAITAMPDIKTEDLTKDDQFMVLACDGIWNVMENEEVVDFVLTRLNNKSDDVDEKTHLSKICEELFDKCIAPDTNNDGTGCDNMTAMIVKFHHDGGSISGTTGTKRKSQTEEEDSTNEPSGKQKKPKTTED